MIKPIHSDAKTNAIPPGITREALSGAEQINASMPPIVRAFAENRQRYLESPGRLRKVDWRNGGGKKDGATPSIAKIVKAFSSVKQHMPLYPQGKMLKNTRKHG